MRISTRGEAIEKGVELYQPTKPCKHGHQSIYHIRYGCMTCKSITNVQRVREQRPVSYQEAIAQDKRDYYPKEPCINGHICIHSISTGCRECRREKEKNRNRSVTRNEKRRATMQKIKEEIKELQKDIIAKETISSLSEAKPGQAYIVRGRCSI